jgi:hypothetical protein
MLFHLGDLEYKKKDQCGEGTYDAASSILKRSRVPVFVVPGDNDLNGKLWDFLPFVFCTA